MTRGYGYLSIVAIGFIALVAGVGRLMAGYREPNAPPDVIRIPILLASAGIGLAITGLTVRAAATLFLEGHPRVRPAQLALTILGALVVLALAFVAGAASTSS